MRMPLYLSPLALLIFALLMIPSPASADTVIYSNLNSSPAAIYASGAFGVSNTLVSGFFQSVAASFTSPGNFEATQLELAVQFFDNGCPACSNNTPPFNLSLVTSVGGQPGSTVLFSQLGISSEPTSPVVGGVCCSLFTLNLGPGVFLNAGQTYWLVAAPTNGASTVLWQLNNVGAVQPWSLNNSFVEGCQPPNSCLVPDSSAWTSQSGANPAFAVFGDAVATPEPAILALVVPGGLAVGLLKLTSTRSLRRA